MKRNHSIVFFVIIFVVIAAIFLFEKLSGGQDGPLAKAVGCESTKIDQTVYDLQENTSLIGAFVVFDRVPISEDDKQALADIKVRIDENSWLIDYARAEIPTDSLCALAELENVKKIFIPNI